MPRSPVEGLERAKKTADKYITSTGREPSPSVRRDEKGFELVMHKRKIQNQRAEIDKLKLALKTCKATVAMAKHKGFIPED